MAGDQYSFMCIGFKNTCSFNWPSVSNGPTEEQTTEHLPPPPITQPSLDLTLPPGTTQSNFGLSSGIIYTCTCTWSAPPYKSMPWLPISYMYVHVPPTPTMQPFPHESLFYMSYPGSQQYTVRASGIFQTMRCWDMWWYSKTFNSNSKLSSDSQLSSEHALSSGTLQAHILIRNRYCLAYVEIHTGVGKTSRRTTQCSTQEKKVNLNVLILYSTVYVDIV